MKTLLLLAIVISSICVAIMINEKNIGGTLGWFCCVVNLVKDFNILDKYQP